MKKSLKSIVSKFSLTAFALLLMQSLSFAADPEVYVSTAPVSDISGQQLLNTTWFWVLIVIVIMVFATAFFATAEENKNGEPHAL